MNAVEGVSLATWRALTDNNLTEPSTLFPARKCLWPDARTVIFGRDDIAPPAGMPIDAPTLTAHRYHCALWNQSRRVLWLFEHTLLPTVAPGREP